jgi:hypothetical protein
MFFCLGILLIKILLLLLLLLKPFKVEQRFILFFISLSFNEFIDKIPNFLTLMLFVLIILLSVLYIIFLDNEFFC